VLSPAYADARLAALYDALNPPGDETGFYLSLAGQPPQVILDMGCGTGQLARAFAARGHQVTGADPAAAMLAVARTRPGGEQVRWIETDAAGLAVPTLFDLIVLTGHVFQLLLDDRAVRAALGTLRRHLAPHGRLAFETRNPEVREWQYWSPAETRQRIVTPGGPAVVHYDISSVTGPLVSYETCIQFPGGENVTVPDTLRFMDQAELAGFLTEAGLTDISWYGDWDRSPVSPASPEIIAVAGAH
jgi:SAM-dependent methyltransferase